MTLDISSSLQSPVVRILLGVLAAALLSITINPLMFRLIPPTEKFLQKITFLWRLLDRHETLSLPPEETIEGHVVIVG